MTAFVLYCVGAMLPTVTIILPLEETQLQYQQEDKTINIVGRLVNFSLLLAPHFSSIDSK